MNTVRAMSGKCQGILKKPVAMNPAHYCVRNWCFQYHRKCDTVQYRCKSTYHWLILLRFEFWLFLPRIASATVLLLRHTPPAASQTTHCHGYGYCWLWRYKGDCVIVKGQVACIVLWCRPKHSVDVDAPEEMVWVFRGLSVWTMLIETKIYYPW